MISKSLRTIDECFDQLVKKLDFSRIDPRNSNEQQDAFMKNGKSPSFTYKHIDPSLKAFRRILPLITLGNSPEEVLLAKKKDELVKKISMMEAVGSDTFTMASQAVYPPPSADLVAQAEAFLSLPRTAPSPRIPRKAAIAQIKEAFKQLGFIWTVRERDIITSARIHPHSKTLTLRKGEQFSQGYVSRLIVHELATHALRTENGAQQPLQIFKYGLAGYLETEEGLAAYHELITGHMTASILRRYAGRVLAVHLALQMGFSEVYARLREHFSEKLAWKLTLRAKRGVADPSKPGAYTKDVVYLRGLLHILTFAREHDITTLYSGKIGISDIPSLTNITTKQPTFTPDKLFSSLKPLDNSLKLETLPLLPAYRKN